MKRPKRQDRTDAPSRSPSALLPKLTLLAAGMLLMFLLQMFFWPGRAPDWPSRGAQSVAAPLAALTNAAPWGRLLYTPLALDRPEDHFTNDPPASLPPTRWVFPGHSVPQLQTLLAGMNLSPATVGWLGNPAHWAVSPRGIAIQPDARFVASLSPAERRALYGQLARYPENFLQSAPFRFRTNGFDSWFADCQVPPDKIELVRNMTYEQDGSLCFADAPTVAALCSPDETRNIIRCLWRVSTFLIEVQVTPDTDMKALLDYWGALGPAQEYKPLLESVARTGEQASIPLAMFLPPFARLRLYTYPHPRDPTVARQDCFWSAMNFFSLTPDDGFFDPAYTQKALERDYVRVRDQSRRFGDLIMLLTAEQEALHMCVYIADDLVFTKNGANPQQPWVLMKLPEMLAQYGRDRSHLIRFYRRTAPVPLGAVQVFSAGPKTL